MDETKRNYLFNFLRSMIELKNAIEPFQEQQKELKKEFAEKGWLTKEEQALILKAYAMAKKDQDLSQLQEIFNAVNDERERGKLP
jgi:hypothetical protein